MSFPDSDTMTDTAQGQIAVRLANVVWSLVAVVLVLFAIFVGVGRQLSENVDHYRPDLEALLTETLGYQVHIGRLDTQWHWLDPVLHASDVSVMSAGEQPRTLGSLGSLRIQLDTLMSLLRFRVVFESFEADGLGLTLVQSSDGHIRLDGLSVPETSEQSPTTASSQQTDLIGAVGRWLSDPSVRMTRVSLKIQTRHNEVRHIDIPQLDLDYGGGLFSASGRAMQAGTTNQLAAFRLLGRHFFRGDFTGQIYLNLSSGRLFDGLVSSYHWRGLGVDGFDVGGEAWLTFESGVLEQVNGEMVVPYLQLRAEGESLAPMEDLALKFGWRGAVLPGGGNPLSGELHLKDIQWHWLGESVSEFALYLRQRDGYVDVKANGVPVGPLSRLALGVRLLPELAVSELEGYQPEGRLDNLKLVIPYSERGPEFSLTTDFHQLNVAAFHGAPELMGANGTLEMGLRQGHVRVLGENVTLGFPKLFRSNWSLSYADVEVGWTLDGPLTRVYSSDIHLLYQDDTELSGAFDLRMDREGEDNLGLQVAVRNGNAGMLADFVPEKVVAPALYQWLTTAIPAASIDEGVYYGFGQVDAGAPRHSFTSSMWYRFSDGRIKYDPAWPEVTGARGKVSVHDGWTSVILDSGQTGGLSVAGAEVKAEPGDDGMILRVDASTEVPGAALPYWVENSPVGDVAGPATGVVEVEGTYQLDLGLEIPLGGDRETVVDLTVGSRNGLVRYPAADLSWTDIVGDVHFNSRTGFAGDAVTAQFMGKPVTLGIEHRPEQGALSLSQTGRLSIPEVMTATGLPEDSNLGVNGTLVYSARLDVTSESTSGLSVYSSLRGVEVDWPAPLAKPADAMQPVNATLNWTPEGVLTLVGRWEDTLAFRLRWNQEGFERAGIALGATTASLPRNAGVALTGRVPRVDVEEWAERVGRAMPAARGGQAGSVSSDALIERWLSGVNLAVGQLEVAGQTFSEVNVNAGFDDGRWRISTQSEQVSGDLSVPVDTRQTVVVNLERLHLAGAGEEEEAPGDELTADEQVAAFNAMQLQDWPPIQVTLGELMFDERPMGSWSFRVEPSASVLHVRELVGTVGSMTFSGDFEWGVTGGKQDSRLVGTLAGEDLADLAPLIGEQPALKSKNSQIELDVAWPGQPQDFALTRLEGQVGLRLDDGVILENNYTAQLFRLFNVLNADTLWRRLRLDFSDLYEAGVAFDAISGTAVLSDGVLTWSPELQIVGPSGAFKLSGSTDMIEESLDMRLVVVLPVTQNLPLAALLLGASAPIGGALFVLDKVLGDPLSRLTSATYSVQGSWSEPEVNLRNVFDTGN
ncbi:YhdP family protein [Marinobacter zhejiangensis]|uniref:TIGR02099 family protein n=1 Tax=Marinobacter zhejiangensis TaxID=488535 RepID=A0A1I4QLI7_9GAMM|nr:YhdP family protein [Marinobacter zhejiangensis]SFM40894.1 TIGR02099 family protein [Marinobacter zhejiangensis]